MGVLNIHVTDTRGLKDRIGCILNVNAICIMLPKMMIIKEVWDVMIKHNVKWEKVYEGGERNLYVKYIVKWVDWNDSPWTSDQEHTIVL